jgi:hypothetical protein
MSKRILAVDIYYYSAVNWASLAESPVKLVVIKADGRAVEHARRATEIGRAIALYHWADPTLSVAYQAGRTRKILDEVSAVQTPRFIAFDYEQWWLDWGAWYRYLKTGEYNGKIVTDKQAIALIENLSQIPWGLPQVIYTAGWFVKSYGRWVIPTDLPVWWARYITNTKQRASWAEIERIAQTAGAFGGQWEARVVGHQFSDKHIPPGFTSPIDLNWFYADARLGLADMAGGEAMAAPAVERVRITALLGLRVRSEPNLQADVLDVLKYGSVVDIEAGGNREWAKLAGRPGWISRHWTTRS